MLPLLLFRPKHAPPTSAQLRQSSALLLLPVRTSYHVTGRSL